MKKELPKVSTGVNTKYNCENCKDTGWIATDNGYKRCRCYFQKLNKEKWIKFGVNPNEIKKLREYKIDTETRKKAREKAANYIVEFENNKNNRNNSIAFLGSTGSGKTHLSLAIGKALMEKDVQVVYMPYLETMRELKSNCFDEEGYIKMQRKYTNAEVLIMDDLFKDKVRNGTITGQLNEADMKHIYPIINQRYIAHKPTIYSSECNINMLMDLDEALGGRIYESCKDNIIIFKQCKDNNYRLNSI